MADNDTDFDVLLKLVIIGDSGVGKSNYLYRFVEGEFCPVHESTVGFDYKSKTCTLPKCKKTVKFQVWDTAGQEKYMSINKNLFQRVQGIILMYDIARQKTFDNLEKWMELVNQLTSGIPILLIGNKIDLIDERKISKEMGESFAKNKKLIFFESSGKTGENVEESFIYLGEEIMRLNNNNADVNRNTGNEYIISKETTYNKNQKKKGCC